MFFISFIFSSGSRFYGILCVCRKPYINVNRWFNTIVNQPEVKAVIGEFKLCEKETEFDAKKIVEQGKASVPKDKKEKKKEVKKEAPKKEAPPPAEELDPTEEALAAEPKSKDPFDSLPKGCVFSR